MKVVLANGTYVKTSRTLHPELFWALRGAGSALGVVTHIKYQLYDYSNVRYAIRTNTCEHVEHHCILFFPPKLFPSLIGDTTQFAWGTHAVCIV